VPQGGALQLASTIISLVMVLANTIIRWKLLASFPAHAGMPSRAAAQQITDPDPAIRPMGPVAFLDLCSLLLAAAACSCCAWCCGCESAMLEIKRQPPARAAAAAVCTRSTLVATTRKVLRQH
jgi:hypothetical protein